MVFNSINDIKEHFGIEVENINDLRKELKKRLVNSHPDKTGGNFKGKTQQREHDELSEAIKFIDNSSTDLAIYRSELTELRKKVDELAALKENQNLLAKENITKLLENHIDDSVVRFQKKHYTLKISSLAATTIITSIWVFPTVVENHPVLKNILVLNSIPFTIIWIGSLIFAGYIWYSTKRIEKKDKILKLNYSIDTTQNIIFKLFCAWLRASKYKNYDYESKSYRFSRDDLFNFVLNHYNNMYKEFGEFYDLPEWDLYHKISEKYKDKNDLLITPDKSSLVKRISLFFKQPGEIDVDLAHKITDTMLEKLLFRNIIVIEKN